MAAAVVREIVSSAAELAPAERLALIGPIGAMQERPFDDGSADWLRGERDSR
jgi:hypothetical protein